MSAEVQNPSVPKRRRIDPAEYDLETQNILEEADSIQTDLDTISERCHEDVLDLEQRYMLLKRPHLLRRNLAVSRIPNFWLTAIKNHPDLQGFIDESEEDSLAHLEKFEVEDFDNYKEGYKLKFSFNENPYFSNTVLMKTYHNPTTNAPTSECTPIDWKEGMQLTRAPGEASGSRRRRLDASSFFHWYEDNVDAGTDDIAEVLREDIWHNPLQYFLVADAEPDDPVGDADSGSSSDDPPAPDPNFIISTIRGRVIKLSKGVFDNLSFFRGIKVKKHYFPFLTHAADQRVENPELPPLGPPPPSGGGPEEALPKPKTPPQNLGGFLSSLIRRNF